MESIVYSAMRTPDGTIIESKHRHDYVTHLDANGKEYMIDGGLDYVRRSANGDEELLTVTLSDTHDMVRSHMTWGTYGKNGDQPLTYVKLMDMTDGHLLACIETQHSMHPNIRQAMINETKFRCEEL